MREDFTRAAAHAPRRRSGNSTGRARDAREVPPRTCADLGAGQRDPRDAPLAARPRRRAVRLAYDGADVDVLENGPAAKSQSWATSARGGDGSCPRPQVRGRRRLLVGVGADIEACGSRDDDHAEVFWANPENGFFIGNWPPAATERLLDLSGARGPVFLQRRGGRPPTRRSHASRAALDARGPEAARATEAGPHAAEKLAGPAGGATKITFFQ